MSKTLINMFQTQVSKSPHCIALITDQGNFTYQELDRWATELASQLAPYIHNKEMLIAIRGQRSAMFIIAILGCLMTGAAYIPLDLSYAPEELAYILQDAQPRVIIDLEKSGHTSGPYHWNIQHLNFNWAEKNEQVRNPLAYVVYTSGLTGAPKGVMVEHRSICSRIESLQHIYHLTTDDIFFHNSPYGFDGSVEEIFLPLLTGCQLVVAPPGQTQAILDKTIPYIEKHKITTLYLMPPLWKQFGELVDQKASKTACSSLKRLIGGGDILLPSVLQKLQSILDIDYYYIYGPTENTINSSIWKCQWFEGMKIVPVGSPLPQTSIHVLGPNLLPVAQNEIGEIYLSGIGLARGYLNKEKLTDERFNFFGTQQRLYKTRDLGRILLNGLIEYIGRKESNLPLEDYYHLACLQSYLSTQKGIEEVMVDIVDGNKIIVYISGEKINFPHAINSKIRVDQFVFVDSFPYTPSGKIDINILRQSIREKCPIVPEISS